MILILIRYIVLEKPSDLSPNLDGKAMYSMHISKRNANRQDLQQPGQK